MSSLLSVDNRTEAPARLSAGALCLNYGFTDGHLACAEGSRVSGQPFTVSPQHENPSHISPFQSSPANF